MIIDFDEKTHTYSINGEIATISVTELLKKHKLSANYDKVSTKKLRECADIGKKMHKELEDIVNIDGFEPETNAGINFKKWVCENISCGVAEQVLAIKCRNFSLAGTADLIGFTKNGEGIVVDHKFTSKFYEESVTWQVSLLDYMARKLTANGESLNGKPFNWFGAKKFCCLHFNKETGEMTERILDKIDDSEIERLLECENNGTIYERRQLSISKELEQDIQSAEELLVLAEMRYQEAKKNAEHFREELAQTFERQGIKSWEYGGMKFTYVEPVDRISVDSRKLKDKYPIVYNDCQKLSKTKGYIRVTRNEEF
jgi:hypothetical protein